MIKAIETTYKGYRFRSRLEARWAVFFEMAQMQWRYEPEGFDLGPKGYYLPDFHLPEHNVWLEIKPFQPTPQEQAKCAALAAAFNEDYRLRADAYMAIEGIREAPDYEVNFPPPPGNVCLIAGEAWHDGPDFDVSERLVVAKYQVWKPEYQRYPTKMELDPDAAFGECRGCGHVDFYDALYQEGYLFCGPCDGGSCEAGYRGGDNRISPPDDWEWHKGDWSFPEDHNPWLAPRILRAFEAARGARF